VVIENGVKKIKRWGERWDIKLVVVGSWLLNNLDDYVFKYQTKINL
jgi:hypothetical protein